jgi:very-short-patch-repair endonuclease
MRTRYLRYHLPLKGRARRLRRDSTPAERKLWYEFLRDLPQRFSRQKPLGRYIADFYCASCALVVEVDGDSHYTDAGRSYDIARTVELANLGIRVLRYSNENVMERFEGVCAEIRGVLAYGSASRT